MVKLILSSVDCGYIEEWVGFEDLIKLSHTHPTSGRGYFEFDGELTFLGMQEAVEWLSYAECVLGHVWVCTFTPNTIKAELYNWI